MIPLDGLRGRARELGLLRERLDRLAPSAFWVIGARGVGKTSLVRKAAQDYRFLFHRAPPLSEPHQRESLARTLLDGGAGPDGGWKENPPAWEVLLGALVTGAEPGRSTVLVVDDAHRWVESRARVASPLSAALARARKEGKGVHVALLAPEAHPLRMDPDLLLDPLVLRPLRFRSAAPYLPGATVGERLTAYAVFGGVPGVLNLLDRETALEENLERLVLGRGAPLGEAPLADLERHFQRPARYASILAALAVGEGDWRAVQDGVADLTASGQAGPYLKRLVEIGQVEVRSSLDAPRGARSRRYRIPDPFTAFWFRFVLPHRGESAKAASLAAIRRGLAGQVASLLPEVCRSFMARDALELLGTNAREVGSLWGPDYDIPVAGTLASGVPFYGQIVSGNPDKGTDALATLDAQIRETRYGFGRERRLRVLFVEGEVSAPLAREVARRDDVVVVPLEAVEGEEAAESSR